MHFLPYEMQSILCICWHTFDLSSKNGILKVLNKVLKGVLI